MHTPEVHKKISDALKHNASQPDYIHSQTGLKRSDESKEKIRNARLANPLVGEKNGMFGKNHSDESKNAMSETRTRLMIEGKIRFYPKHTRSGKYTSQKSGKVCCFKSGWEESVMKSLDEDHDVVSWQYESFRIPYYYNANKRWYVPNFLITFSDGHQEVWEIKPKAYLDTEKNLLKSEAAQKHCESNNIDKYVILTGDELRERKIIK